MKEGRLRSSPDIQAVVGAASAKENDPFASAPQEDTQISAPSTSTPTKPCAEATTQIGSARASLSPQLNSHTLVGVQDAASASSDTSPHAVLSPVPKSPFTPGLELPAFLFGHPYSAATQAPWAILLPFWDPWLSTSMLAAAAAAAMPRPPHCQLQHTLIALLAPAVQLVQLQATGLDPNTRDSTDARYQANRVL